MRANFIAVLAEFRISRIANHKRIIIADLSAGREVGQNTNEADGQARPQRAPA